MGGSLILRHSGLTSFHAYSITSRRNAADKVHVAGDADTVVAVFLDGSMTSVSASGVME